MESEGDVPKIQIKADIQLLRIRNLRRKAPKRGRETVAPGYCDPLRTLNVELLLIVPSGA